MHKTNLRNLVIQILNEKDKEKNEPRLRALVSEVGEWDSVSRYRIKEEYATSTSMPIRAPSRAFPFSELAHVKTNKYVKALLAEVIDAERSELLERTNLNADEVITKKRTAL